MTSPTQPPNQLTQQQQQRQAALTSLLVASMGTAWALIDLSNLAKSLPKYEAAVAALVYKYGQASATLSARYYTQMRDAAGVTGTFRPTPSDPAGIQQVHKSIGWATKGLWSPQSVPVGSPQAQVDSDHAATPDAHLVGAALEEPDAVTNARTLTNGAAQKMVVDTGRNTLLEAIEADKKARGWAREAKPNACAFCALISTRGMVFKSEQTAGFEAHSHCHCIPVPVFSDHYEPPAYIRQWTSDYYASTRGVHGMKNLQIAWRRAYEGRTAPAPKKQTVNA